MEHRFPVTAYLEDTDAQGVVYHASYLRFFERARSEYLAALGIPIREVAGPDHLYVIYEVHVVYRKAGRLGDRLEIRTAARRASAWRLVFDQAAWRGDESLVTAEVHVVCVDGAGNLVELPDQLV